MELNIRIAGEAGQGVETTGSVLIGALAALGLHVFSTQTYMSRIRGGLNWFDIRIADHELFSRTEETDLLVAFTPKAVETLKPRVAKTGLILSENGRRLGCRPTSVQKGSGRGRRLADHGQCRRGGRRFRGARLRARRAHRPPRPRPQEEGAGRGREERGLRSPRRRAGGRAGGRAQGPGRRRRAQERVQRRGSDRPRRRHGRRQIRHRVPDVSLDGRLHLPGRRRRRVRDRRRAGRGRDRRREHELRRHVRRRARDRHDERRRLCAHGRGALARGHARAADRHHDRPAPRPGDRPAHAHRAAGPAVRAARRPRRVSARHLRARHARAGLRAHPPRARNGAQAPVARAALGRPVLH